MFEGQMNETVIWPEYFDVKVSYSLAFDFFAFVK